MMIKIVEYFKISRSYLVYSFILQFLLSSGCGANQKLPQATPPSTYKVNQKTLSGSELYSLLGSKSNCDQKSCAIAVEVSKNQKKDSVNDYANDYNNSFVVSFDNANDDTHYEFLLSDSDSNFSNYSSYSSLAKQGYNSTFSNNHQAIINYANASYLLPATLLPGIAGLSTKGLSLLILSTGIILTGTILASSGLNEGEEFQGPRRRRKRLLKKPDLKEEHNNQNPSPTLPIFTLPEEESGNQKSNPNKHLVRLSKSQIEKVEKKSKYGFENLPSFKNKRPLDDLLLFDQKLAKLTSYKLTLKNNSNAYNQLSFDALELLNKKLFDYYELTNEKLFQNLTNIFGLYSQRSPIRLSEYHKVSFWKTQRRTFALWLYKNNDPLAVVLALNLLTNDYGIDTDHLAKLFNSSHQQVLSSKTSAAKFITYNYFAQDLFSNMDSIEKIADYMLIKFSLTKYDTMKDIISLKLDLQINVYKFLEKIYTFIDFYKLDATDLVAFLTDVIKFFHNNFSVNQAISRFMDLKNPANAKHFKNKKEMMEKAFIYWILANSQNISYERIKNVSHFFDEELTNFEQILYPKKDIKFVFNDNKSSIRYRSDNMFSHKVNLIYNNLVKDHPNLIKDYPSDVIKNLIIIRYLPKPNNVNVVFARKLNIDLDKLISILQLIEKYLLKFNSSNYVRKLEIGKVIDNDPEYFSLLFKDILEFKGTKPIIQPEIIKNLIIDFHDNKLKNYIERVLFVGFVLKHKQPSWPSLQSVINIHKELFPDFINYNNIFDPNLYKEESLMETLKLTHKIAARFVEYVALHTEK